MGILEVTKKKDGGGGAKKKPLVLERIYIFQTLQVNYNT